jgi:hypothetical protein
MDFCGLLRVFESSQEVRKSEVIRLLGNKANPHNRKKKNIFFGGQLPSCPAARPGVESYLSNLKTP